jgi:hypothetical protein
LYLLNSWKKWYCHNYIRRFPKQGFALVEFLNKTSTLVSFIFLWFYCGLMRFSHWMITWCLWIVDRVCSRQAKEDDPRIWTKRVDNWNRVTFEVLFVWRV